MSTPKILIVYKGIESNEMSGFIYAIHEHFVDRVAFTKAGTTYPQVASFAVAPTDGRVDCTLPSGKYDAWIMGPLGKTHAVISNITVEGPQ